MRVYERQISIYQLEEDRTVEFFGSEIDMVEYLNI